MKSYKIMMILFFLTSVATYAQGSWIRINQLGYQNNSVKVAVFVSLKEDVDFDKFDLINTSTGQAVYTSSKIKSCGEYGNFKSTFRLDFSEVDIAGKFFVQANGIKSPEFHVGNDVYDGTADFILKYMRQQRCGYNPFLKDSCHTHDGFIVDRTEYDSTYINVVGGWHDATDYLQYLMTSANATYQMLFAYKKNPEIYKDEYKENGDEGANGIPDILDEAKWGLDWMVKMNPEYGVMYNQIADDRDHAGFRLPTKDSVNYGKGLERPVYFITGKQQGLAKYKNRTTGVSSSAAKYASAFALGAELLNKYYPDFAEQIKVKAEDAYKFALTDLGVTQTACNVSPYFYEEDNYVDDMELAAAQLYLSTQKKNYLDEAGYWGKIEQVTPWMGADTARHYQWYPFVNLAHYLLAAEDGNKQSGLFKYYLDKGLRQIYDRGKTNAFLNGIPFIWCSNNLLAAAVTQAKLYEEVSNDEKYKEMEAALRDWLFGCNPWGTSMIVGLPANGDYPLHPHSSLLVVENYQTLGGLVDGPVYGKIFNNLIGVRLVEDDEYKQFQSGLVVYHDDVGDFSTNEPTMDGTASLSFYLSSLEAEGKSKEENKTVKNNGAVIRGDVNEKKIYLMFTGGDYGDGCKHILDVLKEKDVKAHFFFTGDFYRNPAYKTFIADFVKQKHYLGAHSDKHLLYSPWENRDSTLITKDVFITDINNNYKEMEKFGILKSDAKYFMPPFEWYNKTIAKWTAELGLELICFTPGTRSTADYTTPDMGERYLSSDEIYKSIFDYESSSIKGLNGFYLLIHVGTHPDRTDKFYYKLGALIDDLKSRGYTFSLLTE